MDFKLVSKYQPTGDQPEAISYRLRQNLYHGQRHRPA